MIWNNFFTSSVIIITGSLGIAYLTQKRSRIVPDQSMTLVSKRNLMTGLGALLGAGTSCLTIYRWNLPQIVTIPMGIMLGQSLSLWGRWRGEESLSVHRVSFRDIKRQMILPPSILQNLSNNGIASGAIGNSDHKPKIVHSDLQIIRRLSSKMDESDEIPFEPLNCSSLNDLPVITDDEEITMSPQSIIVLRTPNNMKPILRVVRRTPRSDSDQASLNLALEKLSIKNNRN